MFDPVQIVQKRISKLERDLADAKQFGYNDLYIAKLNTDLRHLYKLSSLTLSRKYARQYEVKYLKAVRGDTSQVYGE